MLVLDQVSFQYAKKGSAFDFSLKAQAGEAVAVMGASGSGKSTLFDLIAGFQVPALGSICWEGEEISATPPGQRPVSILFQNNNLFEHLSAHQNIALGLSGQNHAPRALEQKISQALDAVGLEGTQKRLVSTLSGGQQQRVAFARSLARNKPILLLDEPFTGLDDNTKSELLIMTREMATVHGRCVIMVTHDEIEAKECCDRAVKVVDGKLEPLELGSP